MPTKPKMGRPPKPPAEKQDCRVMINLTGQEFIAVCDAATLKRQIPSEWIRRTILRAAARRK